MGREVTSFRNLDDLQDVMAKNSIVVRKKDALDLPETTDVRVPVTLSPREQRAYDEMKRDLATLIGDGLTTVPNRLAQMMRLRQITAGHAPTDDGRVVETGTSKIDTIKSIVHDTLAGESRIVVFALFKHEIAALAKSLDKTGTEVLVVDGSTPDATRLKYRRRFGSGEKARIVLVAQIKTISLAVNELVTASHAVFASLSQQRDDLVQARDRLHRIGQAKPCTYWFPLARGTIDEVIFESHETRTSVESAVLDHIRGTHNERKAS